MCLSKKHVLFTTARSCCASCSAAVTGTYVSRMPEGRTAVVVDKLAAIGAFGAVLQCAAVMDGT